MQASRATLLFYGSGSIRSAMRTLGRVGAQVTFSCEPDDVTEADGLVVPGVGAFGTIMRQLRKIDAPRPIGWRLAGGRPVLGICVGMQVMFERSDEHKIAEEGLGQWPGTVSHLRAGVVPHVGWNLVRPPSGSVLSDGVIGGRFYFIHSHAATQDPVELLDPGPTRLPQVTWATYGHDFIAAAEDGSLSVTQFHPEKSGDAGAQLLHNWLTTL